MEREEHNIKDIVQDADERAFVCLEGESKQSLVPPVPGSRAVGTILKQSLKKS